MDERLIKHRVYGHGRVRLTAKQIEHYNKCLEAGGIEPTELTEPNVTVDGGGWSEEIAAEKAEKAKRAGKESNLSYLNNGGAVQYGIIVSPDQMETNDQNEVVSKPVLHPLYSFERHVYDEIYRTAHDQIANITSRAGIWVQIDPGFVRFEDPRDLGLVKSVSVELADTAGIMAATSEQRALVKKITKVPNAWKDDELRAKLIASSKERGDLRDRNVVIPPMNVPNLEYVVAEVFGGTFSLRNPGMKDSLLVVAGEAPQAERGASKVYTFGDSELMTRLFDDGFVELSADWYRANPGALKELNKSILVDVLQKFGLNDLDWRSVTPLQTKRLAIEATNLPKEFLELERYQKAIEIGTEPQKISKKLRMMLMRPKQGLPIWAVRVIWRLISRMTQFAGLPTIALSDLYLYDKPSFFEQYAMWPELRKLWAIEQLEKMGLTPKGA